MQAENIAHFVLSLSSQFFMSKEHACSQTPAATGPLPLFVGVIIDFRIRED